MDQLKVALAWLKQHHFWLLVATATGASLGGWYSGSASLASRYDENERKIESVFSSVNQLKNAPFKPNETINRRQRAEVIKQVEATLAVWADLYNFQQEEVINWPAEELGPRFVNAVKGKSFGDPILGEYRELYQNYIKKTFKNLLEIVDAEPLVEGGGRQPRAGRGIGNQFAGAANQPGLDENGEPLKTYLVDWIDQDTLRQRLDLERTPSSLQIWVLQEDLWVYETLLEAIKATNAKKGAARNDRAAIQQIQELQVGQAAAKNRAGSKQSRLVEPDSEIGATGSGFGAGAFGGGGFGGNSSSGAFGGGGGFGDFGGGGIGETESLLLAGRYLDDDGNPIETIPEDFKFGRGFKRLPVRMVLKMDTNWLPPLMWELANAPLQVEITELRFNPDGASRSAGSGGDGETLAFDRRPTLGTVVLQGNVYLFNPPEEAGLAPEE